MENEGEDEAPKAAPLAIVIRGSRKFIMTELADNIPPTRSQYAARLPNGIARGFLPREEEERRRWKRDAERHFPASHPNHEIAEQRCRANRAS